MQPLHIIYKKKKISKSVHQWWRNHIRYTLAKIQLYQLPPFMESVKNQIDLKLGNSPFIFTRLAEVIVHRFIVKNKINTNLNIINNFDLIPCPYKLSLKFIRITFTYQSINKKIQKQLYIFCNFYILLRKNNISVMFSLTKIHKKLFFNSNSFF